MGLFKSFGGVFGGREKPRTPDAQELPRWTDVLGPPERLARFEDGVRRYFARQSAEVELRDGSVRAISGPMSGEVFGLTNLSQLCAQHPEDAWAGQIARHFMMVKRTSNDHQSIKAAPLDEVRDQLVVRLWERVHLGETADANVGREDIPGLMSMLAIDLPESIASVARERAQGWGVPEDELFAIAMRNQKRMVEPEVDRMDFGDQGAAWLIHAESYYTASLALDFDRFAEVQGAYGSLMTIPVRHAILAAPLDSIDSIEVLGPLLALSHKLEHDGPGSISRRVWWRRDGGWSELPVEVKDGRIQVSPTQEQVEVMNRMAEGR